MLIAEMVFESDVIVIAIIALAIIALVFKTVCEGVRDVIRHIIDELSEEGGEQ